MSPTEDELRAALRRGEGDGLDADTVLLRAQGAADAMRQRRARVLSAGAIAAVVAGIGVSAGLVLSHGSTTHSADSKAGGLNAATAPTVVGEGTAAAGSGNAAGGGSSAFGSSGSQCPATLPADNTRRPAPSPSAAFFDRPVASILICAYPESGGPLVRAGGVPVTLKLTGTEAASVAASIEHASGKRDIRPCPLYRTANAKTLLLIPTAQDGSVLPSLTTPALQNPCNAAITNGTAIRYDWNPPAPVQSYLERLAVVSLTPVPGLPSHS